MMNIQLNGEPHQTHATTLLGLAEELGLGGKRYAIELNGEIIPKTEHACTAIVAGAQLEVVQAIGGG